MRMSRVKVWDIPKRRLKSIAAHSEIATQSDILARFAIAYRATRAIVSRYRLGVVGEAEKVNLEFG